MNNFSDGNADGSTAFPSEKLFFKTGTALGYLNEGEVDGWHSLDYEENCHRVRVIKVTLNTGEIETLVTNLTEDEFPYEQAGDLYFNRWRIEVKINELKEKLALERMRGRLETTVMQDFYATMRLSNVAAVVRWSTEKLISESDMGKNLKYKRKTDVNRLLLKLRGQFYALITESSDRKRNKMLTALTKDIARFPVDVVPGRSSERKAFVRKHPCNAKNCAVD